MVYGGFLLGTVSPPESAGVNLLFKVSGPGTDPKVLELTCCLAFQGTEAFTEEPPQCYCSWTRSCTMHFKECFRSPIALEAKRSFLFVGAN